MIPGDDPMASAVPATFAGMPAIQIPRPFILSEQDDGDLKKLRDECMDKIKTWEKRVTPIFTEYFLFSDSWRVKPRTASSKKPYGLFNSKSGETHRATETLATVWFRMLTASDKFFEVVAEGFDQNGQELTPEMMYAIEAMLAKQLRQSHFKPKLARSLRSLALFGTAIFEEPWVCQPYGPGAKAAEYTDLQHRSLIQTAFDTSVFDIDMSSWIATIDFPDKWLLRNWASVDQEAWDRAAIEEIVGQDARAVKNKSTGTNTFTRINESKARAGYTSIDEDIFEFANYHGRMEADNSVIGRYCEANGIQDPTFLDWSAGVLNGDKVVKFHIENFGTWHSRFKSAHFKLFEMEPYGYGVGRIGRKGQREQDVTISRASDVLTFALYSMWKVGRYAGLKSNQLNIKPHNLVELEDITQLEPIRPDLQAISMALEMLGLSTENFRQMVGAHTNLQAAATKAGSATEAALSQTEAIRGASVHAEIIGETFIREHLETMYQNNLQYLDEPIWVAATGEAPPGWLNKENLPPNVGFEVKVTTDKDFRPERLQRILEALNMATSIRNVVPNALNVIQPLFEEWFRALGMNPRLLNRPIPMDQQMQYALQQAQRNGGGSGPAGGGGSAQQELQSEQGGEQAGSGAQTQNTPVGPVPTSPISPMIQGL